MSSGSEIHGIPRRVFLAYGSAAISALWLKPAGAGPPAGAQLACPDPVFARSGLRRAYARADAAIEISVGYCPLSDTGTTEVVAANSVRKGDSSFLDADIRMTILGMAPVTPDSELASLSVDILYDVAGHDEPLRVHAWRFTNGTPPHYSPGNSFVVPINTNKPLRMAVESVDRLGARVSRICQFTTGAELGLPKLMRGLYFLAPAGSPDWGCVAWRRMDAGAYCLFDKTGFDNAATPVKFPHIAMTMDYSRPSAHIRA